MTADATIGNMASTGANSAASGGIAAFAAARAAPSVPSGRDGAKTPEPLQTLLAHFMNTAPKTDPLIAPDSKPQSAISNLAQAQSLNAAIKKLDGAKPLTMLPQNKITNDSPKDILHKANERVEAAGKIKAATMGVNNASGQAASPLAGMAAAGASGIMKIAVGAVADMVLPGSSAIMGLADAARGAVSLAGASMPVDFGNKGKRGAAAKQQVDTWMSSGPGFGVTPAPAPAPSLEQLSAVGEGVSNSSVKFSGLKLDQTAKAAKDVGGAARGLIRNGVDANLGNALTLAGQGRIDVIKNFNVSRLMPYAA